MKLKVLAGLLYFFGLFSEMSEHPSFEEISYESVRIYYHRLRKVLKPPRKKERRSIAVDETKTRLEKKQILVWAAVD